MGTVARAQEPTTLAAPSAKAIIVLADRPADPIASRIRAELEMLGFVVTLLGVLGPDGERAHLEAAARTAGAIAALRVGSRDRGVDLWIADRGTGKTALSATATAGASESDDVVAIRAVEVLRAALLDLGGAGSARGGPIWLGLASLREPHAASVETRASPLRRGAWSRGLGEEAAAGGARRDMPLVALGFGVGTTNVFNDTRQVHAVVGVEWLPVDHPGVGARVLVPLARAPIEQDAGHATVAAHVIAAGPRVPLFGNDDPWLWTLGGDVGAALLEARGWAKSPFVSQTDRRVVFAGYFDNTVSLRVAPPLRLSATLLFGTVAPRSVIRFAGEEVASFGQPLYTLAIGAWILP